jgi:regulation of enolase protein 1 (concanavalin A-like superfamily)
LVAVTSQGDYLSSVVVKRGESMWSVVDVLRDALEQYDPVTMRLVRDEPPAKVSARPGKRPEWVCVYDPATHRLIWVVKRREA